jgi:hypothetical protein
MAQPLPAATEGRTMSPFPSAGHGMRSISMGLLVLAFLSLAGCTHAPWRPYAGWQSWRSHNVVMYADTLYEQQEAFDWLVSSAEILQRTFFTHVRVPAAEVLYVHPGNDSRFINADGQIKFGLMIAELPSPAIVPKRGLLVAGRWSPYAHLMAHHFIEAAVPRAPLWFHEGLAEYLGVFTVLPEQPGVVCFGQVESGVAWQVTVAVKDLLAVTWSEYNRTSAPWVAPSAWGLIDFLFHGEDGRWRSRLQPLINALAAGRDGEQALLSAFPDLTLDELDERVRQHVRTRKPRGLCPLPIRLGAGIEGMSTTKGPVEEKKIRAIFEALEQMPNRRGHSHFFPLAMQ